MYAYKVMGCPSVDMYVSMRYKQQHKMTAAEGMVESVIQRPPLHCSMEIILATSDSIRESFKSNIKVGSSQDFSSC
jgi:hypothetical protein